MLQCERNVAVASFLKPWTDPVLEAARRSWCRTRRRGALVGPILYSYFISLLERNVSMQLGGRVGALRI